MPLAVFGIASVKPDKRLGICSGDQFIFIIYSICVFPEVCRAIFQFKNPETLRIGSGHGLPPEKYVTSVFGIIFSQINETAGASLRDRIKTIKNRVFVFGVAGPVIIV